MKKTLLQKAKEIQSSTIVKINKEEVELAVAWANDEIRLDQVREAFGIKIRGSQVYARLALALKKYFLTQSNKYKK